MTTVITADSGGVSGTAGLKQSADSSGILALATGTGTTAVTIDASQNVGIGTSSVGNYRLNIKQNGTGDDNGVAVQASANDSVLRVFHTGSTAGLAATYGSTGAYVPLTFLTNGSERMRIDTSGNLLVGTTAVSYGSSGRGNITVGGSGGAIYSYQVGGVDKAYSYHNGTDWNFQQNGSGRIYMIATGSGVYLAANGTSWTSNSDERLKDIIEPITDAAAKVSTLRAVIGKYKTDEEGTRRSFLIAQDVQAVLPEAVDSSDPNKLGVQYAEVVPLLVAAIKEQQALITQLQADVAALKGTK